MIFGRKTDYRTLGRECTLEEFEKTFKKLKNKHDPRNEINLLFDGAAAAFYAGRPEKMQTVLGAPEEFAYFYYADDRDSWPFEMRINVMLQLYFLSDGSKEPEAMVKLALEKVPPYKMQDVLDKALVDAIEAKYGETFIGALLAAGADANSKTIEAGLAMTAAVRNNLPRTVIKLLSTHGGDFAAAEDYMVRHGLAENFRDRLEDYRQKVTPPADDPDAQRKDELIIALAENLFELTKRVDALESEIRANAPAAKQPPEKPHVRRLHAARNKRPVARRPRK